MSLAFRSLSNFDHALVWLQPMVKIKRRPEDRLQRVILFLHHRFKLVIVATRTLECEAEERRPENLYAALDNGVLVYLHFQRIAVALSGAIRRVAPKVKVDKYAV